MSQTVRQHDWYQELSLKSDVIASFRRLAEKDLYEEIENDSSCAMKALQIRPHVPVVLREGLNKLLVGTLSALHVRGLVDVSLCGPTPSDLPTSKRSAVSVQEAQFLLAAAALGHPFGWTSIQHGNLINEVHPVEDHAELKRSSGFSSLFDFHTEDAFHPFQEHFLALLCVRNNEGSPTVLASIDDAKLDRVTMEILRQSRFSFPANAAHDSTPIHNGVRQGPVLSGDPKHPFLRVNFNQPMASDDDSDGQTALQGLQQALHDNSFPVVLHAGDILFIDNLLVAHARDSYHPAPAGQGRWLKRIYVTSNHRCLSSSLHRAKAMLAVA